VIEGSISHPGEKKEQRRETMLYGREERGGRGYGNQREERQIGGNGRQDREEDSYVIESSVRNQNPYSENKRETMLYGSRGERERGQPQSDEQVFVMEGSITRQTGPEENRRETMLYQEGAGRGKLESSEREQGQFVMEGRVSPQKETASPKRETMLHTTDKQQEDQKERLRRRREQLDKLNSSPSNKFTSPVSIDQDRFRAVANRAKSRGFDLGLSFTDEKDKPSKSAFKNSPTAEPFFGQYKELRLQRYEKFHSKLQELMKELSVEERTRLLPEHREESQETELKREWKFVKDLVQTLVKANKRIRELERIEKATTSQYEYDRRRYGAR
jgi:hypothetical protein